MISLHPYYHFQHVLHIILEDSTHPYYSVLVLRNQLWNFGGKLAKVWEWAQNFNAGFVKLTLYNIFSYILSNAFDWRDQT